MKVSVSTYIGYTYEVEVNTDPTVDLEEFVWEAGDQDPAFDSIAKILTDKGFHKFDAETISICNAETGEILYEG